ncbi:hypothetical protein [Thalassomonas sp. RHCl1]|uniref:hypothetical protein n=1 Tax=Thalassomonas sp. RHCl1 TaxID=2995320 RepID=UPI00248BB584|nr:hypothetical protein [Thalassomonas sp. RHCl1]
MKNSPSILTPINEAVNFLELIQPEHLSKFRESYPELSEELKPGIIAGSEDYSSEFIKAKANIMLHTLERAINAVKIGSRKAAQRITWVNRIRTGSEILVLVGSSSVLGTINLANETPHILAAAITLIASCGSLLAKHTSRITSPKLGNINVAYTTLSTLVFETSELIKELKLALRFSLPLEDISDLISRGNQLMARVNKWDSQVLKI